MQAFTTQDALAWAIGTANNRKRLNDYATYRRYYDGDHELRFATKKFKQAFGDLFEAFAYNRCSPVVDTIADRLMVERFAIGSDETREEELERQADDIWLRNSMGKREREVYIEALTCGDAYVLVWPDPETERPIIWPQSASQCSVRYSDEQPDRIILGTKRWRESDGQESRIRLNVYHPDRIERWVTPQKKREWPAKLDPQMFVPFTDDEAGAVVANQWDTVPLFHFANAGRTGSYGTSELVKVIPLNNALNKTLADLMIAEEFSAFIQKVVIGVDADPEVQDGMIMNPSGAHNARQLQGLATGAERIIALASETAKIGEWSASALDQFEKVAEGWDARISRVTKIPVHYLTLSGDFPSGRALRTAEAPFIPKVEADQRDFGEVWEDVQILALRQDGTELDDTIRDALSVVWRSAAPLAEEDKWDLVLQMTTTGVPLPVALKRIGWTEDEIAELSSVREEEAEATMQREITMLTAGQMAGDEEDNRKAA